jgi:hypothetical protein
VLSKSLVQGMDHLGILERSLIVGHFLFLFITTWMPTVTLTSQELRILNSFGGVAGETGRVSSC